jgi:hypothetical protein
MVDSYQQDAYLDQYYAEPEPMRGRNGWLIALIVILALIIMCCVCCFIVVAAMSLLGPTMEGTFSTIIETMEAVTAVP